MFHIVYYETERGQKPVEEFISSLDINMKVKVLRQLSAKGYTN